MTMQWTFKKDAEPAGSGDTWYDLTEGYIDPKKLLANKEQIKTINDAIATVLDFLDALENAELLREM
jgi:hypothetical protein